MITALITIVILVALFITVAYCCFNDLDPDLYWYDNYTVISCSHIQTKEIIVSSNCGCETIHVICKDCEAVISKRTEC